MQGHARYYIIYCGIHYNIPELSSLQALVALPHLLLLRLVEAGVHPESLLRASCHAVSGPRMKMQMYTVGRCCLSSLFQLSECNMSGMSRAHHDVNRGCRQGVFPVRSTITTTQYYCYCYTCGSLRYYSRSNEDRWTLLTFAARLAAEWDPGATLAAWRQQFPTAGLDHFNRALILL